MRNNGNAVIALIALLFPLPNLNERATLRLKSFLCVIMPSDCIVAVINKLILCNNYIVIISHLLKIDFTAVATSCSRFFRFFHE